MRRLSIESRTARSKGWPFSVVVAMMGSGSFLDLCTMNLFFDVVAVKPLEVNFVIDF
jgi:hypothetical protein